MKMLFTPEAQAMLHGRLNGQTLTALVVSSAIWPIDAAATSVPGGAVLSTVTLTGVAIVDGALTFDPVTFTFDPSDQKTGDCVVLCRNGAPFYADSRPPGLPVVPSVNASPRPWRVPSTGLLRLG